jgi:DNA-binding NarL/FixJ family response regulator
MNAAVILCRDLLFSSRVVGAGQDLGVEVRVKRTANSAAETANDPSVKLLIVDLEHQDLSIADFIEKVHAIRHSELRVLAYGPHVDKSLLESAGAVGFDEVFSRRMLLERLPELFA